MSQDATDTTNDGSGESPPPSQGPTEQAPRDAAPRSSGARGGALLVCGLGLTLGALSILVIPSSWLFIQPDEMDHSSMGESDGTVYACPMFCVIMDHLPEAGKCPVCGMTMTLVSGESTLNAAEQHMIGLETDVVRKLPLVRSLRVVGEVDYDETRLARITTRVGGWLETVWVDSTWMEVGKGEPLAAIYSPELYAAEQEYLVAWNASRGAAREGSSLKPSSLLRAARRRLELLEVGDEEIATLEKSGVPRDSVVLRAPFGGAVVERRALEGASVAKGAMLYTVADLSRVWVQALVFESDLDWVRVGQSVTLETDGHAAPIKGVVAFVDPAIDRRSRTARVRVEVDNAVGEDGLRPLRIGQRIDLRVSARLDAKGKLMSPGAATQSLPIAIPRASVLRTGERNLVYVLFTEEDTDGGRTRNYQLDPDNLPEDLWYEAVQVRVGPLARVDNDGPLQEYYPVLGVIAPPPVIDSKTGEKRTVMSLRRLTAGVAVVSKGNLLLDSQAQLAGKPSLLFPEGNRSTSSDPHAGH